MNKKYLTIAMSVVVLTFSQATAAPKFKCGPYEISVGDSIRTVLEHCGQPTSELGRTWLYERQPAKFNEYIHYDINRIVIGMDHDNTP